MLLIRWFCGLPVAWPAGHGYAARVSRLSFHRWAVIFLLVSNLILGQFAHAMPHAASATTDEVVAQAGQDNPACGEHAPAGSSDSSQDSEMDGSSDEDCCERGECACPCLHSTAAGAVLLLAVPYMNAGQIAALVEGAAWHRLSALFRPPA